MSETIIKNVTNQTVVKFPVSLRGLPGEGLPAGGTSGQVATKASSADYDVIWSDPGSSTLSYFITAGQNLSAGRAVMVDGGSAYYFQPSNTAHHGRMCGVTRTSAVTGASVEVRPIGFIEDAALSFDPNKPLWVSTDGEIVDEINPVWLVIQKAGVSLENDKMVLDFSISILK